MSRPSTRVLLAIVAVATAAVGCDDLDARASIRKANRLFRDTRFIDAANLYEGASKTVKDDRVEYNIGLTYSRIFRGGGSELVLLAEKSEPICTSIPGTQPVTRSVCVKIKPEEEDRAYPGCKKDQDCPTSATCKEKLDLCAIDNASLAKLSAQHLSAWIAKQPSDDEIKKSVKEQQDAIEKQEAERTKWEAAAEAARDPVTGKFKDKAAYEEAMQKKTALEEQLKAAKEEVEETKLKFTIRDLMTNMLVEASLFDQALAYWDAELKSRPTDFEAMGKLAGINLKSGNWRKAIEWYLTIAEKVPEESNKVVAFSSVGNVAWSKLNSKTLLPEEAIDLADLGIGALQKASALAPKNLGYYRLQVALYNFRAVTHGVSWAAFIDRASGEDLKALSAVVSGRAKATAPGTPAPKTDDKKDEKKDDKKPAEKPGKSAPAKGTDKKAGG